MVYRDVANLSTEPSFKFLSQLIIGQRINSSKRYTLTVHLPKNKTLHRYTQATAEITPLSLSGPISEEVSGHSASGLVMSPAAQYRHRAGTAEDRQSWQDGATGTLLHLTQSHANAASTFVCACVYVCVCVPLPLWGQSQRQNGGPWRNCCQKGSRGVCGNQWDDGSGLSCASHLESSPLISRPETLANQFGPANKYYVGWQNLSVQMSCRTCCCFKLWHWQRCCVGSTRLRLSVAPRKTQIVSEPVTVFYACF